jgi:phosphoglycolate phosphatase-like HAD superfamily hydrolase
MLKSFRTILIAYCLCGAATYASQNDPLPSWNAGSSKPSILEFVERVTTQGGADFVPPEQRIATFDNDGTLWSEQPMYFQLIFALDRIKATAPDHPEWARKSPALKAAMAGDVKGVLATGKQGLMEILATSHTGMTESEFSGIVTDWVTTARHPRFDRLYSELVYQPMLELLAYLRANEFKTYITSGGGISFMRPWAQERYGIPREQVIGSSVKHKFEMRDGGPVLVRLPEINFIDDKAGKPVGINMHIGRRPTLASAIPTVITRCCSGRLRDRPHDLR